MKQKEQCRQILQRSLDAAKTQIERNRFGQFGTPSFLALDILSNAKKLFVPNLPIRFLDPAIGTGSFYSALIQTFPENLISYAKGFEIDSHYADPAIELWKGTGLSIEKVDFTKLTCSLKERYNLIICNPPYVRHHHIIKTEKSYLQCKTLQSCGINFSGLSGLYCYFLGLCHVWMEKSGLAGWLIPSEFMDVKYGKAVKSYLLDKVTLLHIHRFDPNELQFDDAMVSSCVVWFRNNNPPKDHAVRFTFGGTIEKPKIEQDIPSAILREELKWTRFPLQNIRCIKKNLPRIADFFEVKRGIATGANEYFILNRSQIKDYNLPFKAFQPILPSPRYLDKEEILADFEGNPIIERQLFLLNCKLNEEEIKKHWPPLAQYLENGKNEGIADRYLCRHRRPWYAQENRPPPPFICTYLGRQGTRKGRPFRFIFNQSKATIPNVYLALYPRPFLLNAFREDTTLMRKVWMFLNNIAPEQIVDSGRIYGGGLYKIEPNELATVPVSGLNELCQV